MCPSPGTLKSSAHAKEADWELGVIGEGMGTKGEVVIMAQGKAQLCPHGSDPHAKLEKAQTRDVQRDGAALCSSNSRGSSNLLVGGSETWLGSGRG